MPAAPREPTARGVLVLAATPIGDVADASPRLRRALETADVIAAEDTRRLRRLAGALGVTLGGHVVAVFDAAERGRADRLLDDVESGRTVLVVTDAGMPVVSDPGYLLVRGAIERGLPVTAIPGPSAVTTAIALAGLPADRFAFEGFLPRRPGERRTALTRLAGDERTLVFFESPRRLAAALADLATAFGGDRRGAVCRELTKTYEEVRRGPLAELAGWAASSEVLGEITLVVEGARDEPVRLDPLEVRRMVDDHVAAGHSRRDAVDIVATTYRVPRRRVYDIAVGKRDQDDQ